MKAILATQELIDNNPDLFSGVIVGTIVAKGLPDKFNGTENINAGGYRNRTDLQDLDGWKDVVQPSFNTQTQKKGGLILDVDLDVYTYEVIDLTQEEINQRIVSESQSQKEQLVQKKLEDDVLNQAQSGDDTSSLDNQALFPLWINGFDYSIDYKCQDFDANNELVLYKCVQSHTSQSDWRPKDVPALFTRVAYPDEILDFVQPTGAQDAYQTGDKVYFPAGSGIIFESLIDANVWSPTAYPAGWNQLN